MRRCPAVTAADLCWRMRLLKRGPAPSPAREAADAGDCGWKCWKGADSRLLAEPLFGDAFPWRSAGQRGEPRRKCRQMIRVALARLAEAIARPSDDFFIFVVKSAKQRTVVRIEDSRKGAGGRPANGRIVVIGNIARDFLCTPSILGSGDADEQVRAVGRGARVRGGSRSKRLLRGAVGQARTPETRRQGEGNWLA